MYPFLCCFSKSLSLSLFGHWGVWFNWFNPIHQCNSKQPRTVPFWTPETKPSHRSFQTSPQVQSTCRPFPQSSALLRNLRQTLKVPWTAAKSVAPSPVSPGWLRRTFVVFVFDGFGPELVVREAKPGVLSEFGMEVLW